ncbi:MAG: hypothetical protein QM760_09780 [Nibricoccus sp.]
MKSFIRPFVLLCAVSLASAIAGFVLGRSLRSSNEKRARTQPSLTAQQPDSASSINDQTASKISSQKTALTSGELRNSIASISSPADEAGALTSLRLLAATDSARALEIAQSAPTPRQRDEFVRAVLQGWASADPLSAARWALANVRLGERRVAVEALFEGAIAHPDAAIEAANLLCASDPLLQSDHGNALVSAFARAGRFDLATQFATTSPGEFRAYWLSTAFSRWAQYQPDAAIAAAGELADSASRKDALQGIIAGWAMSDPASLVTRADKFPAGETRTAALRDGLQQWVSLDPVAAAAWMDRLDPSRELDAGAAAVATTPVIVEKKPDVATSWAESIVDPELRANTLLDLIRLWAERDPAAARSYAANSPALRPETRAVALASFEEQTRTP